MRRLIRWVDADGRVSVGVEREAGRALPRRPSDRRPAAGAALGETFEVGHEAVVPDDPDTLALGDGRTLLAPARPARGLVRGRHLPAQPRRAHGGERRARTSTTSSTSAPRPELFLKDARRRRTVGPGRADRRSASDSIWNVPEPEIGLVLDADGTILALHDRQRRLLARDRGREPALPEPGEGLRRRVRDRPRARACRRRARTATRSSMRITDEHGELALRGRDHDGADGADASTSSRRGSCATTRSRRAPSC